MKRSFIENWFGRYELFGLLLYMRSHTYAYAHEHASIYVRLNTYNTWIHTTKRITHTRVHFPSTYRAPTFWHVYTCMNLLHTPSQISSRKSVRVPEYAYMLIPISLNLLNTNFQLPHSVYINDLVMHSRVHSTTRSYTLISCKCHSRAQYTRRYRYRLVSFHTYRCTYISLHSRAVHVYFSFNTNWQT